ncbi:MAG TPA: sugar isomerase domain-containing protein, partial [Chloroflexota bacterium]
DITSVACRIGQSLMEGGILHVFGSGHGMIFAKEAFNRSGGLIPVNPLYDAALLGPFGGTRKTALVQDMEAYAPAVFEGYDVRPGEVLLQFSASGTHPLVCEVCLEAQRRGLHVVAVTNVAYSEAAASRHSSGKRLFELADQIINNPGPIGDAAVDLLGVASPVGATSTATGVAILNAVVVEVVEYIANAGATPPILYSHTAPNAAEHNRETFEMYRDRMRHL